MDWTVGRIAARKVTTPPLLLGTSSYPPFQGSTNGATDLSESRGNDKKRRDHCRRLEPAHASGLREPEIPSLTRSSDGPDLGRAIFSRMACYEAFLEEALCLKF